MYKENKTKYIVRSISPRWAFLNGYSCNSIDRDHFIRHLGYRFKSYCTMYQLNQARLTGDIRLEPYVDKKAKDMGFMVRTIVVNEYWDDYGYIIEVDRQGTKETKTFVSDVEANEWIKNNL